MERISDPRVSPDGTQVAFVVRATDLEANRGRLDLYLAATDGSRVRRLTSHEAADSQPRWSADGRSLYFVSTRSGQAQVWRLSLEGGEAQPVTRLPARRGRAGGRPRRSAPRPLDGRLPREVPRGDERRARGKGEVEGLRSSPRPALRAALGHLEGRHAQPPLRLRHREGRGARPHARDGRGLPDEAVRRQRGLHGLARRQGRSSSRPATSGARRPGPRTSTSTRSRSTRPPRRRSSPRTPPGTPSPCSPPTGGASPTWR